MEQGLCHVVYATFVALQQSKSELRMRHNLESDLEYHQSTNRYWLCTLCHIQTREKILAHHLSCPSNYFRKIHETATSCGFSHHHSRTFALQTKTRPSNSASAVGKINEKVENFLSIQYECIRITRTPSLFLYSLSGMVQVILMVRRLEYWFEIVCFFGSDWVSPELNGQMKVLEIQFDSDCSTKAVPD